MSSYRVTVDLSEVERLTFEGEDTLHRSAFTMWEVCDAAAKKERESHRYQNRTSNTEQGTLALPPLIVGTDAVEVELAMRTEYSSFLVGRDFSDFPDIVAECETNVTAAFEADAAKLSRL